MKKISWFNVEGQLINIGEWDEMGGINPLPPGAYSETREIIQTADGGLALADDYVALRRAAYPPYSVWDVLDEALKLIKPDPGSKLDEIQTARLAVKAKYPKPEGSTK